MDSHALVQRLFREVFNERKYDALPELVAENYVEHALAPFGVDAPGNVNGPIHMRNVVEWLAAQFPDIEMTPEVIVAEGDVVVARVASRGTNLGPLNGVVPPTGRSFSATQDHWYHVVDGKLSEHWAVRDDLATMLQLGVLSPPGPPR